MGKLKTLKEIRRIIKRLKQKNKKVVFTNGCFDILHYGHIKYLEKCKRLGNVLVIGLNSDASVRKIKEKNRPIKTQKERAAILSALEFVDYITIFDAPTPEKLIRAITPDVLVKGGDWRKKNIVGSDHVKTAGGHVVTVPFVKGFSTSGIISKIKKLTK